jgi:hypothetical protein
VGQQRPTASGSLVHEVFREGTETQLTIVAWTSRSSKAVAAAQGTRRRSPPSERGSAMEVAPTAALTRFHRSSGAFTPEPCE